MPDPAAATKSVVQKLMRNIKDQDKLCSSLLKASKDSDDLYRQSKIVVETLEKKRMEAYRMLNDMRWA